MKERNSVRYGSEILPENLNKVDVSWGVGSLLTSDVINCCAHGIRVSIPSERCSIDIPKKNDSVKVLIPFDQVWITGMCVYSTREPDGSASLGIYFYHPSEQNYLNTVLSNALNIPPQDSSFVCHEWEELVDKLCNSEDSELQEIGYHKRDMLAKRGVFSGQTVNAGKH